MPVGHFCYCWFPLAVFDATRVASCARSCAEPRMRERLTEERVLKAVPACLTAVLSRGGEGARGKERTAADEPGERETNARSRLEFRSPYRDCFPEIAQNDRVLPECAGEVASHSAFAFAFRAQGGAHATQYFRLAERLHQIVRYPGMERSRTVVVTRIGGDQYGGNAFVQRRYLEVQLQPGHARHIKVGHQAGRALKVRPA